MSAPRTRVMFVVPTLRGGGAERVMVTLLRQFDRELIDPVLVIVDGSGAVFGEQLPADLPVVDLRCSRVRYAIPRLVQCINDHRPSVVLSTLSHLNLALALLRPILPRTTRFVAREAFIVSQGLASYRFPALWRFLYRWLYKRFDLVICQSQTMLDDLILVSGIPVGRTVVVNNPVDVEWIDTVIGGGSARPGWHDRAAGTLRLIAAGRLSQEKGFDILIDAIALLPDHAVTVAILGEGPLEGSLRKLADQRGVSERVRFLGFQRDPFEWFAQADALVLSSRHEGFPNVLLEALACGTPIIATPAPGGTREILAGIPYCEVAHAITAPALADAIGRWRAGGRQRIERGAVARFLAPAIARRYEELLVGIAGPRA